MSEAIPSRRQGDKKLDEVLDRLTKLEEGQRSHMEEFHANLDAGRAQELVTEHIEMRDTMTVLLDLVAGRKIYDPITHEWHGLRAPGLVESVKTIENEMTNFRANANSEGGIRIRVRTSDTVKIAVITSLATVFAAALAAWAVVVSGGTL